MHEAPSTEFKAHLFEPSVWALGALLGALFLGFSALLGLSWVVPGGFGMRTGPATAGEIALSTLLVPGGLALGGWLLVSTLRGVLDYRSDRVEILQISVESVAPVRGAQYMYFHTPAGHKERARIPADWSLGKLPSSAELWRTPHGHRTLRLRFPGASLDLSALSRGP